MSASAPIDPSRPLSYTVPGPPVPAQPSHVNAKGFTITEPKVKAYREHVRLYTLLHVRAQGWTTTREDRFALTLRFFIADLRTVDCDNLAKACTDGIKGRGEGFPDDSQVVAWHLYKYVDRKRPRTEVVIEKLPR